MMMTDSLFATQNEEWIVRYNRLLQEAAALTTTTTTTTTTTAEATSPKEDGCGGGSIEEEAANLQALIMTARAGRLVSLQCALLACDDDDDADVGGAANNNSRNKASVEMLLLHTQREMDVDASSVSGPLQRLERLAFSSSSSSSSLPTSMPHSIRTDNGDAAMCTGLDIDAFFQEYPECIRQDWGVTEDTDIDSDSDSDVSDGEDHDDGEDGTTEDSSTAVAARHRRRKKKPPRETTTTGGTRPASSVSSQLLRVEQRDGAAAVVVEKENLQQGPLVVATDPPPSSRRPPSREKRPQEDDTSRVCHGADSNRHRGDAAVVPVNPYQKFAPPPPPPPLPSAVDLTDESTGQRLQQLSQQQHRPPPETWLPQPSSHHVAANNRYSHAALPRPSSPHHHNVFNQAAWADHRNRHNPFQTAREVVAQTEPERPFRDPHRQQQQQQQQQQQRQQQPQSQHQDQYHRDGSVGSGPHHPASGAVAAQPQPPPPPPSHYQNYSNGGGMGSNGCNPFGTMILPYDEQQSHAAHSQPQQPHPFHCHRHDIDEDGSGRGTGGGGGGPYIPESLKRKFAPPKKGAEAGGAGRSKTIAPAKCGGGVQVRPPQRHTRPTSGNGPRQGSGGNGGGDAHHHVDEDDAELPEALQHLEKDLVLKIQNEIMESGDTITFDDIAGLADAKQTVQEVVCWPMKRPDLFTGLRRAPNGLLLYGPPGTGKTLIGKAIAHESGATFFSISSSSLTSKWIGEGEKLVRTLFAVAAYREPAVVFIDEIDSLLTQRKSTENEASRRIKTEFLVQLDGTGTTGQGRVLVIGATNRPQELDEAARRRFVKRLYIPLPSEDDRRVLLHVMLKRNNHELTEADIDRLARETEGFSGADLKSLCTDAAMGPIRQLGNKALEVSVSDVPAISFKHFKRSLKGTRPSVAPSDLLQYEEWDKTYGSKRSDEDDDSDDDP